MNLINEASPHFHGKSLTWKIMGAVCLALLPTLIAATALYGLAAPLLVLVLAGLANASFCALFGGDWCSRGIVFVATVAGFFLKQRMTAAHVNHYIVFALSAFVASLCASVSLFFDTTAEIALSTSVLFLVPGVPLINGVIDILEGHMLNGFARLANAALLIVCIAVGLSFTLMLVKDSLL